MDVVSGVVCAALGYLLGAIPSGVLVGRLHRVNVQNSGSGHTGGLDVYRTTGSRWALALTALADVGLAVLAVSLARRLWPSPRAGPLAGVMAIVGHNWSVYIGLAGGVGLSSLLGGLLALSPSTGLLAAVVLALIFLAVNRVLHHSPRSTIVVMLLVGPLLWILRQPLQVIALGAVGALPIIVKELGDFHRVYESSGTAT